MRGRGVELMTTWTLETNCLDSRLGSNSNPLIVWAYAQCHRKWFYLNLISLSYETRILRDWYFIVSLRIGKPPSLIHDKQSINVFNIIIEIASWSTIPVFDASKRGIHLILCESGDRWLFIILLSCWYNSDLEIAI